MVFSSPIFLFLFLPIVLAVNFLLPIRLRNLWLLIMSLIFYGWGEPRFVLVMIASIVVNFALGLWVDRVRGRPAARRVMALGIALNIGLLAVYKYAIFAIPADQLTAGVAWLGVVCYALQIYYDFSGYSDMAIGLGLMLGFHFLENFNYPYISRSMTEFWRRWHISLSTWFRDYLYIPLGGNQRAPARTYFNLVVTFFLCGLWHGAAWTFVIWGLYHGLFLVIERLGAGRWLERWPAPARHG